RSRRLHEAAQRSSGSTSTVGVPLTESDATTISSSDDAPPWNFTVLCSAVRISMMPPKIASSHQRLLYDAAVGTAVLTPLTGTRIADAYSTAVKIGAASDPTVPVTVEA